jgi:hypothetical protein
LATTSIIVRRPAVTFGFRRVDVRIDDAADKRPLFGRLIDALYPGRNALLRPMTDSELKRTALFRLPLEVASAQTRAAGPVDDGADFALPVGFQLREAVPDSRNQPGLAVPAPVRRLKLG